MTTPQPQPVALSSCPWPGTDPLMLQYHDTEWGVPVHSDRKLYEFMVLDAFQAGLSWRTVLHKRAAFEQAFAGFDPVLVAAFTPADTDHLLLNPAIIRNRQKIQAAITNAQAVLQLQASGTTLNHFLWQFTGGRTLINAWTTPAQVPATSPQSNAMSTALKARGFKFVGSTICYAFMQAAGLVNDHLVSCPRFHQLTKS